jgi:hypothetical protein
MKEFLAEGKLMEGGLLKRFFDGGWIDWWAACENDSPGGLLSYARD